MQSTLAHRATPMLGASKLHGRRSAPPSRRPRNVAVASVVWRQVETTGAWVAHARSARVKGVIHFLGGAFAGAAPQVLYNLFAELLADRGYTVIATPYAVTFQHLDCARQVHASFLDTIEQLRAQGRGYLVPRGAPTHGVGHSNGALLLLLIGALFDRPVRSNVVISFNNLQVQDAIPIPGFLDGLQPTVQAARGSDLPGLPLLTPGQVLAGASAALPRALLRDRALLANAAPLLQQLESVVGEVGDGITNFSPSPEESRALIGGSYSVPATLMVRFVDDSIDQTPEMLRILQQPPPQPAAAAAAAAGVGAGGARAGTAARVPDGGEQQQPAAEAGTAASPYPASSSPAAAAAAAAGGGSGPPARRVEELALPGSHVTPCGSDLAWEAGPLFTPLDAVAQGLKAGSQADVRRLATQVLGWLDGQRP